MRDREALAWDAETRTSDDLQNWRRGYARLGRGTDALEYLSANLESHQFVDVVKFVE